MNNIKKREKEQKMLLIKPLVNENLVLVPPASAKFTIGDHHYDARQKKPVSEDQQILADRVLGESDRLIDETRNLTDQWKKESDFRLKERLVDIQFLLDEVKRQKTEACKEEEALKIYRNRLLNTRKLLDTVKISVACIALRENRIGIDLIDDGVEKELKRELNVFDGCRLILDQTLTQVNEQIRRLRASNYLLDRDLFNKDKSYFIDEINLSLRPNQQELSVYEGSKSLENYNTTHQEWEKITIENVHNAAKELNTAKPLRSYCDVILKQVVEDLSNQVSRTNEAFMQRISEIRYAKATLERLHNETATKVNDITRNITRLEKELSDKEGFVALCQMRLANRAHRPGPELCKDNVHNTLSKELQILKETVGSLNKMLDDSKATLRYLLHTQMTQEEQINIKTNSLKIDEVDCMTAREGLKFTLF